MRVAQRDTAWERTLFRLRLWFDARIMPFRIRNKALAEILALYEPSANEGLPRFSTDYLERSIRWAVRRPLLMRNRRCFRSGLLGYQALRRAGYDAQLHFSVSDGAVTAECVEAHCWVTVEARPVVNRPQDSHVLLFTHPRQPAGARSVA